MSATELLQQIEQLPDSERLWLLEKLLPLPLINTRAEEESAWSRFSAGQLLDQYGSADSVYDKD